MSAHSIFFWLETAAKATHLRAELAAALDDGRPAQPNLRRCRLELHSKPEPEPMLAAAAS